MANECNKIMAKSWCRTVDTVNKIGFMNGASDAQNKLFQVCFDKGYKQGYEFGLQLGFFSALLSTQENCQMSKQQAHNQVEMTSNESQLMSQHLPDNRRINCQICLGYSKMNDNVRNLYNIQKENNNKCLLDLRSDCKI